MWPAKKSISPLRKTSPVDLWFNYLFPRTYFRAYFRPGKLPVCERTGYIPGLTTKWVFLGQTLLTEQITFAVFGIINPASLVIRDSVSFPFSY